MNDSKILEQYHHIEFWLYCINGRLSVDQRHVTCCIKNTLSELSDVRNEDSKFQLSTGKGQFS